MWPKAQDFELAFQDSMRLGSCCGLIDDMLHGCAAVVFCCIVVPHKLHLEFIGIQRLAVQLLSAVALLGLTLSLQVMI